MGGLCDFFHKSMVDDFVTNRPGFLKLKLGRGGAGVGLGKTN